MVPQLADAHLSHVGDRITCDTRCPRARSPRPVRRHRRPRGRLIRPVPAGLEVTAQHSGDGSGPGRALERRGCPFRRRISLAAVDPGQDPPYGPPGTLRARVHGPTERGTRARIGHLGRRPSRYGSHCPETTGVSDADRDSPPEPGGSDGGRRQRGGDNGTDRPRCWPASSSASSTSCPPVRVLTSMAGDRWCEQAPSFVREVRSRWLRCGAGMTRLAASSDHRVICLATDCP